MKTNNTNFLSTASATARRLFSRLSNQKGKMFLILATAVLSCITYALIPIFSGQAIDGLIQGMKTYDGSMNVSTFLYQTIFLPVLLLTITGVASAVLSFVQQRIVASVGEELTLSLRKDINDKITKLPLKFFDGHQTGDILSLTTNDLEKVSEVMQTGLLQFISSALTILITIVAMLWLNPLLTLIVLVSVTIAAIITGVVSKKSQEYFAENQKTLGEINAMAEEFYAGNSVIKIFNHQEPAIDAMLDMNEKQYKAVRKAEFFNYSIYPAIRFLNQLGFIATAVAGGVFVIQGRITIGVAQAFLQYVNQISEPITQSSYVISSLQAALAGAERVFAFLDEEEEVPDHKTWENTTCNEGKVSFEHVQFGYSPDKILMHDINFSVNPNEMVAIVGPTGGGKTTLINLLMRFYDISKGSIRIDGADISEMPRYELRRRIGMVLQDTWLFEGTIADNIAYGKPDATRKEIIAAAKSARCHHFITTLPNGYETIISGDAASISQGQMQLLTIARAMLADPIIMILDEATSSVDTRTEVEIQKAMYTMMKDKTSFVIAHRPSTIKNANLILVVKEGDIVETGTHSSLLKQNGFYASLYNSQFEASAS